MSGPYVIVNLYAAAAWTAGTGVATWTSLEEVQELVRRKRARLRLDEAESTIMPLAQYLVEYGV